MSQKVCKPSCLERTATWWQKYHSDLSEQEVQETQLSMYLQSPETPGFSSYELWGIFKILVLLQHVLILLTILIISKASESFLPLVQEVVYTLHLSSTGCWQCFVPEGPGSAHAVTEGSARSSRRQVSELPMLRGLPRAVGPRGGRGWEALPGAGSGSLAPLLVLEQRDLRWVQQQVMDAKRLQRERCFSGGNGSHFPVCLLDF